jgi:acetoin utilization deacetylase AcuC-like enzyme
MDMIVITSDAHKAHDPQVTAPIPGGPPFPDVAARIDQLLAAVHALNLPTISPRDHGMEPISAVHDLAYLHFLETAFSRWQTEVAPGPVVRPTSYAVRHLRRRPENLRGQAGFYLSGFNTPIVAGTFQAIRTSAHIAVEGAHRILAGAPAAYALCRPCGHHAYPDLAGGLAYLNNAAIAANILQSEGAKPAILDVDVHHGNGTQALFYERDDVYVCSVHGDPRQLYPWYAGYVDETGTGRGLGCNVNLPLPPGTENTGYVNAVETGLEAIRRFDPSVLLVSLGFDAHVGDPTANLAVTSEGFYVIGQRIAGLGLPTLLIQEGGYIVEKLSENLTAFLTGFENGRG